MEKKWSRGSVHGFLGILLAFPDIKLVNTVHKEVVYLVSKKDAFLPLYNSTNVLSLYVAITDLKILLFCCLKLSEHQEEKHIFVLGNLDFY